jgi:integrase
LVHHRVQAPSVDQVRKVVEVAEEHDPELAALLMFATLTGMRRSELCGLRWGDVDLGLGRIEVARSVVVSVGGIEEKLTKTNRARFVALDPLAVELLSVRHEHSRCRDEYGQRGEYSGPRLHELTTG